MKRPFKKLTAWLCCMAMIISFIPATALPVFATETEPVELTQAEGTLPAGEYYLSGDLALTGTLTVAKNTEVVIDLAGKNITGTTYPVILVNGKLTITDSTATGTPGTDYVSGTITGGQNDSNANYGMIYVSGGTFTLDGGKLTGYNSTTASRRGGAVGVLNGTAVMNGGEITGNTAAYGAGVFVTGTAGKFTMTGGAIYGNTATAASAAAGGGVFGEQSAVINIEGGVIKNNTAERGSEIALHEVATPTLNISGGTITTSGTGTYDGVYSQNPTLNVSGGTIDRIYWRAGTATISGGTIGRFQDNNDNILTITGNPVIGELAAAGSAVGSTIGPLTPGANITYSSVGKLTMVHATVAQDSTAKTFTYQVPVLPTSSSVLAGDYVLTGDHVLTNTLTIPAGVEVTIDLAGNTISMPDKDNVYFTVNGKLTIKDSAGGGKVQFKDTAAGYGGINIYGTFVLESGELNGWTRLTGAKAGGMLNMWAGSTFTMTGGKITGADCASNTVIRSQTAGDITVTITGGEITGNNTDSNILGVTGTAAAPATVTIGGDANISGNTIGGAAFTPAAHELSFTNAHVTVSGTATVGTLYTNGDAQTEGTEGYPYSSMTFTGAPTVQSVRWSSSANTPVRIEGLTEGAEIKVAGLLGGGQIDGTVAVSEPDTVSGYTMYTYTYEDPNKGNLPTSGAVEAGIYELSKDLTLEGSLTIAKNVEVTIDLKGYKIYGPADASAIKTSGNLTIMDSTATGTPGVDYVSGAIVGGTNTLNNDYGMIYGSGGTITLQSGKLTGYTHTGGGNRGGALGLLSTTFNMTGGEISGNSTANGGGLLATGTSVVTMSGGAICKNTATGNGGGVYVEGSATFNMTGGTISGNTALRGAGVYTKSTTANSVNISAGTISDNTATGTDSTSGGGGLYVNTGISATISGDAVISGNAATKQGGAIYNGGTVTISGGTFTGNEATTYGGVVFAANATTTSITGGSFTGNTANKGGVWSSTEAWHEDDRPVLTISGGTFSGNTSTAAAAAASIAGYAVDVTISGGTFDDRMWLRNAKSVITGGTFNNYVDLAANGITNTLAISDAPVIKKLNSGLPVANATIGNLATGAFIHTEGPDMVTVTGTNVYTADGRNYYCADDVYDVTVEQVAGGTITVSPTAGIAGTTVTVTVDVNDGYQLTGILLDGNIMEGNSFTISKDHTVTATFAEVEAGTIPTSGPIAAGEYELAEGVTLEGTLTVTGEVTIDLAGNTLNGAVAPYFTVEAGGKLVITDSSEGETGKIVGLTTADNAMIYVNGGEFELQAGTLTGHTSTSGAYGGAIAVKAYTNSSVTISGGTITGNTALRGGGISMGDGGDGVTLTITGGTITGNTSTHGNYEGDIYSHSGTYNISGGHIGGATLRYGTTNVTGAPRIDLLDCTDHAVASTIGDLDADAYVVTKVPDALTVAEDGTVFHEPISSFYRHVDGEGEETSILVIGNSFGNDTINYLKKIADKYDLLVGASNMYIGSQNFRWHALSLAESLRNEDLNGDGAIGDARETKQDANEGLYKVDGYEGLVDIPTVLDGEKDWDYIVLQNGVEFVGFEGTYNSDVQFLIDYINDVQPDAQIYFNQTWAEETGSSYLTQFGGDQAAMYDAILRNTNEFFGEGGRFAEQVAGYFPIGNAIQNMRDVYTATPMTRDGYHLSLNAGRMIAGLTVMKTLFDIDLNQLTAADVKTMFDYGVGATTDSSNDAFDPTEENVAALKAAVADACSTPDEPTDDKNASIKQFNPDAAMNGSTEYVAVYENVTEVGQACLDEEYTILPDEFGTAGAGKIVIYQGGTEVGSIDEQWLDEKINDFDLTNRLQKIKAGEEYYIIADPQAPQLAVAGGNLVLTFNLMLYTDNGVVENGGVYFTTSADGATWSAPVKVSDVMGYGLTVVGSNLMMSVKDVNTRVLTLTADGTEVSEVDLTDGFVDVAFAQVGTNIYALSSNGALYISADTGATWTKTDVANGVTASPDLVYLGDKDLTVFASWADEANRNIYSKVWNVDITNTTTYGWDDTEASLLAEYKTATAYHSATTGGQPSTIMTKSDTFGSTVKTVYADSGVLGETGEYTVVTRLPRAVNFASSFAINFKAPQGRLDDMGCIHAKVIQYNPVAGKEPVETLITVGEARTELNSGIDHYVFEFSGIAAKEMGDNVWFAAYNEKGQQVTRLLRYSLLDYANNQIASTSNKEYKIMLVDMLNYGATAQEYFGYATSALVNAHLTEELKALATPALEKDVDLTLNGYVNTSNGVTCAKSLSLGSAIELNFKYVKDTVPNAAYAKISYDGHLDGAYAEMDKVTDKIVHFDPREATATGKPAHWVLITDLVVADIFTQLTVELYDNEGNVIEGSKTVYSMATYAYNKYSSADGPWSMALMKFGKSAYNYLH